MSLKIIDIIFIVIILLLGFGGFRSGFFSQLIIIIGLVLGLFFAYFFNDDLSVHLVKVFGATSWLNLLSFILIFIGTMLIAIIIHKISKESLSNLGAEGADRVLGFIFGAVQGVFISIAITAILVILPFNTEPIFLDSTLGSKFITVLPQIEKIIPEIQKMIPGTENLDFDEVIKDIRNGDLSPEMEKILKDIDRDKLTPEMEKLLKEVGIKK